MKRLIFIFMVLLPMISYGQNIDSTAIAEIEKSVESTLVKATEATAKAVIFIASEVKQFKDEAKENMPQETKDNIKEAKEKVKKDLKNIHDAIHEGWAAGWRGEKYVPHYNH